MRKWALKICGMLFVVAVVATAMLMIYFSRWSDNYKNSLAHGSEIANTQRGDIEYAIAGEGTPILRIHGRPGGYDAVIAGPRARPADYVGFRTIAVSRPGYLRTPIDSGRTPSEQADLYAALLDKLGIRKTVVYGASAGGPSALQFAIRHPDRTIALILVVPALQLSAGKLERQSARNSAVMFLQDFAWWTGGVLLAKALGPIALSDYDSNDPHAAERMQEMSLAFLASDLRAIGNQNDVLQYRTLDVERWPLEQMTVPVLIVHGTADTNAPYSGSFAAAARIPHAKLVTVKGGRHTIIVSHAMSIREHIQSFLDPILLSQ